MKETVEALRRFNRFYVRLLNKRKNPAEDPAAVLSGSLDPRKSARLRAALFEVEALLKRTDRGVDPKDPDIRVREADPGDLGWIITRHAEIYGREFGFTKEFETYVLLGLAEYVQQEPSGSRVWIAERCDDAVGSVGIVALPPQRAQLRWLLVEPHARGLGAGRKLVAQAVSFCRERNYRQVLLWTLQTLHAARALYGSFGFQLIEEKKGMMGGRPMIEECWSLALTEN